jgi:AraC-like DNA-binding protein
MSDQSAFTIVNRENGNLAFKLLWFSDNSYFDHIQRNNYYSLIWIIKGIGIVKADFSEHIFQQNSLFAFTPYQPFMMEMNDEPTGIALQFHPDFFCIHKHHQEVACHGILFNNIYEPPFVSVNETASSTFYMLIEQMKNEVQNPEMAGHELLVSYLKIFLITASRLRKDQQSQVVPISRNSGTRPFILQRLKEIIEQDFKIKHSPGEYAEVLCISTKALAKITKSHFNKTPTELIAERIVIEAKRELYLTNKSIKEIAYELGYDDEYYFSRFFKINTDISPQAYRETVGFARGVA